jgi:uncharacterized protein YeaO (DUF488 family)
MAIHIVRLGSPRHRNEGVRLGTVRRPPRGVRKENYSSGNYYDLWLPDLAPSAGLVSWITAEPITKTRWAAFSRGYRREMRAPAPGRLIALLAMLSRSASFSVGCYCGDESRCHRSILRELLAEAGAVLASTPRGRTRHKG